MSGKRAREADVSVECPGCGKFVAEAFLGSHLDLQCASAKPLASIFAPVKPKLESSQSAPSTAQCGASPARKEIQGVRRAGECQAASRAREAQLVGDSGTACLWSTQRGELFSDSGVNSSKL